MTPLAAKLVFLTSSALGAATLGSTAYLVEHPRAFSPEPVRPLAITPLAPRPLPPEPAVLPEPVVIPAVVVTGEKAPRIPKAQPAAKPAQEKTFVPCSEWREMGPTNVNKGGAASVHRVRKLCT
ncbi:MAG TPA: hypothetical protein VFZ53_10285 [Polyangiaceae bacterium]